MKAMVFAAGYGTRLKPLTDKLPKALVPLLGKPMIGWVIDRLKLAGVDEIIINVHYLADQLEAYCREMNNFGIRICFSDERERILDTGGGLCQASWFFDDGQPFFVYNTDVISSVDLNELLETHRRSGNLATLAVKHRPASRNLIVDKQDHLAGWRDNRTGEEIWVNKPVPQGDMVAFSGIQVINPEIFGFIVEKGVFPLIPLYLRLAKDHAVGVVRHDQDLWFDLGNSKSLREAEESIGQDPARFSGSME
ncbi:MAG: nucleotidyltransferase family protein [Bacteroidales bacterium]